jgi:adenosylcobinamide-GDP ribazoletransferase
MNKMLTAFQFLTIVPVGYARTLRDEDIAGSVSFFVVVGVMQGLALVGVYALAGLALSQELAAALALLVLALSNGGFHLDGLADTMDAMSVKSSGPAVADRERRLRVMKDGGVGPIGAASVFFSLGLQYLGLKTIAVFGSSVLYASLFLMPAFSKWSMVVAMFIGKPAREHGLGKVFIESSRLEDVLVSSGMLAVAGLGVFAFLAARDMRSSALFMLSAALAIYGLCRICIRFFDSKFGGLTGDTLGCIAESSQTVFFFMVIAWSRLSI